MAFRASRGERVSIETPGQQGEYDGLARAPMVNVGTTVNVYAPEGSNVETQETPGPGGPTIDVIIDEVTANNIGRPGSRTSQAMRNRFGASEQLQGR